MVVYKLRDNSEIVVKLMKVEKLMGELGLTIVGHNIRAKVDGFDTLLKIGRDSDTFPRYIDEPFILDM